MMSANEFIARSVRTSYSCIQMSYEGVRLRTIGILLLQNNLPPSLLKILADVCECMCVATWGCPGVQVRVCIYT